MSSPYRRSNITYSPRVQESEKDNIISQLKQQVFELEQNERDYNALNCKFRGLQNENNLLAEEKLRLEYEIKQRTEMTDKQILELRQVNENLMLELSDKNQVNKKLYADNNNFYRLLEARNEEINELKAEINALLNENNNLRSRLTTSEATLSQERNAGGHMKNQIDGLQRDNEKLNRNLVELNEMLRSIQTEKNATTSRLDETRREVSNLNTVIKRKEESLNFAGKQIDDLNRACQDYKNRLGESEMKCHQLSMEINQLNNALGSEKNLRSSVEKNNTQLETLLKEKDRENRKLISDLETTRVHAERQTNEKGLMGNEIERLKNHIMILTEQNQSVSPF